LEQFLSFLLFFFSEAVISTRINHEIHLKQLEETVVMKSQPPSLSGPTIWTKVRKPPKETRLEMIKRVRDFVDVLV
jgi:hypothetical protein